MAILTTDIIYRLSGGAANSDPAASLGGAKSSTAWVSGIFDDVSSAEASAGDIEYRCLYVKNAHATLTLYSATVWISTNTPSGRLPDRARSRLSANTSPGSVFLGGVPM